MPTHHHLLRPRLSRSRCLRSRLLWSGLLCAAPGLTGAQEVTLTLQGGHDGLQAVLEGNALSMAMEDQEDPRAADYVAAARADYRRLLTGLYAEGYYGGTISIRVDGREASGIAPLDAPAQVGRVEIAVNAGPRFTFGSLGLEPLAPGTELPEGFATGQDARSGTVQAAVSAGIEGWRQQGHALADVATQDVRANHPQERLDVGVRLAPGPRLTFGALTVNGNENVRTERVVAIAGLPLGEVYDPDDVALAALRLRRSGAFSSVALIEDDAAGPGDTLGITAQLTEMTPRRLGFGAEVSTTDGLTLSAYWMHRNLLGGAERLRIDGEITGIEGASGGPDYSIGLSYARPATINPDTDLTGNIGIARLDEPDYLLTQFTADVGLTRYIGEDLVLNAGFGIVTAREETPFWTRDYTLLTMPWSGAIDRRDDPFNAKGGWFAEATVTPFLGLAGSDDGGRLTADLRYYHSFGEARRFTLAARGQLGSVIGADIMDAPLDFLFYSGGGGTVRGQPYQDLGITLTRDFGFGETDVRLGGRSFVGAQIEGRFDVTRSIGVVGFYDFGAIDIDEFPGEDALWHAGAGLGVRYNTAIGPIRLDVATPASGENAGERVQVYIGIGQAF